MSGTWRELERLCTRWDSDPSHRGRLAIPCTECGDYVGDLVYRSNCRVLLEDYLAGQLGLVREYAGAYNSSWLTVERSDVLEAIRGAESWGQRRELVDALRELVDVIESLEDYPLLNDADYSELFCDAVGEHVRFWLAHDAPDVVCDMSDVERDALADRLTWCEAVLNGAIPEYGSVYVRHADMLDGLRELGVIA